MAVKDIQYNTEREKLIIPEYGRHIQKIVDHAVSIEDPEERTKMAKAIIGVMGNLQPHLRDIPDFQHKLWDHLFVISRFKLDIESPYPKLNESDLAKPPEHLAYPQNHPKYRFYGNNISRMIDVAVGWEEGEVKEALIMSIANHMKKCFLNWNKDTVEDGVIFEHLLELSKGKIDLKKSHKDLTNSSTLLNSRKRNVNNNTKRHKSNYKSNNRSDNSYRSR